MADAYSWLTLLPAIGFGGLVAALVTAFVNYIVKQREFYIDISNQKMTAISKLKPQLVQLSEYYMYFATQLRYAIESQEAVGKGQETVDYQKWLDFPRLMYTFCNILTIHRRILEEFGGLQLDDLEAEAVLRAYRGKVTKPLLAGLKPVVQFELSYILVKNDKILTYREFLDEFVSSSDNNQLYLLFENKLRNLAKNEPTKDEIPELQWSCTAYAQLLSLELNQIYEMWYKGGPTLKNFENFGKLHRHIKDELKSSHPCYYCRISEFDFGKKEIFLRRILRPNCYKCYLPALSRMVKKKQESK